MRNDPVGTKKKIPCPECDGSGTSVIAAQEGGVPIKCSDCNGTGFIEATVVKNQ